MSFEHAGCFVGILHIVAAETRYNKINHFRNQD